METFGNIVRWLATLVTDGIWQMAGIIGRWLATTLAKASLISDTAMTILDNEKLEI